MERFRTSDYRFIAICLALLAATTWYSAHNFYRAFPEASIDFRVNREGAQALAGQFLTGLGYRTEGYRQASSFTFDDTAKTFLEREAGLEQANRLMGNRVRLWQWSYRWFRPLQKEEFQVQVTPRGEIAGFTHEIAEDAARPAISADAARTAAEEFLRGRMHRDPAALDFLEVSEVTRPHRVDRAYTWKEPGFNLKDATQRIEITLLGSEVGGYREYLKVPDQWQRDYQRLRSKNEVASTVDSAFMVLMLVGLAIVIVIRVRRHDVDWQVAGIVGLLGMALSFCSQLNQLPLEEFSYPTTDSYGSFMLRQLLQAVISSLGAGGLLFVLTAGAEPLYRETFREKVALRYLFSLRGLRTKRFLLGSVLGITLTGIFVAYQTGFYIFASRLGAWSPADVPYSDLLNTKFPWMFVLFGGFLPAVSEEFLFRMFGIPFLRKATRSLAVAIVAAGFIWGFGHAAYPQQPFYIRGVEVGIGGVALGLVMLRWGILPTLVWHYSVDAMYSAMLLLRSESLYYRLSGAASAGIVVLPVAVALVAYWRKGGFEPEAGLRNADQEPAAEPSPPPAPESAPDETEWTGLPRRYRIAAIGLLAVALLALLVPVPEFGGEPDFRISADAAAASAERFLRAQDLDPAPFLNVTLPQTHWGGADSLAAKYFLEREPVPAASSLFQRYRPVRHWLARYFKSLDQEEMLVSVHPETGRVLAFAHTLPEDRPGADLDPEAARAVALRFASAQGIDLAAMDLKENRSEKRKARRDYTLVWEARADDPRNVGGARFRQEFGVAGDKVNSMRQYWWLPEAFTRARSRQNFLSVAVVTLRFGLLSVGIVFALWMLLLRIRQGRVPWRTVLRIAVPASLLTAVGPLLSRRLLLQGYDTAIPLETFVAMSYLIVAMSVVFGFLVIAASCALLLAYFPASFASLRAASRRIRGVDAVFAAAAGAGMGLLAARGSAWLSAWFHAQALYSIASPDLLAATAPAIAAIASAVRGTLLNGALLAAVGLAATLLPRRWMLAPLVMLAPFLQLSTEIRTPAEFALQYLAALLSVIAVLVFFLYFGRQNFLAYALVLWLSALRGPMMELLGSPNPGFRMQGWVVLGAALAGVLWTVYPALSRPSRPPGSPLTQ